MFDKFSAAQQVIVAEFNQWLTRHSNNTTVPILAEQWLPTITPAPKTEGTWFQVSANTREYRGAVWELATAYKVEFPVSTKAFFAGSVLEKPAVFEFQTATPVLKHFFPSQGEKGVPTNAVVVLCFDQQLNASKFAQKVKFSEAGLFHKAGIWFISFLL